jgi:hypothetical protein
VKTSVIEVHGEVVDTVLERLAHPNNAPHVRAATGHVVSSVTRALETPRSPDRERSKEATIARSARTAVRAAIQELKGSLPNLIAEVARDPSVQKALNPLSRAAGAGAAKGFADTLTGHDSSENGE